MIAPLPSPRFSRRAGLSALGGALLLAGCSNAASVPTPTASPTGSIRDQLQSAIGTIAAGQDKLGVAVLDLRSGASWNLRGDWACQSASMAKPMIVSMALRKAAADKLQQPLPPEQDAQANKAIKKVAEDGKYDLVLQDAVYASPRIDITGSGERNISGLRLECTGGNIARSCSRDFQCSDFPGNDDIARAGEAQVR